MIERLASEKPEKVAFQGFLASGDSIEAILREYPQLSREDVLACIAYGAERARERLVPITVTPAP